MPADSFHSMQEGWKREIQGLFDELRAKEKVGGVAGLQGWKETPGRDALYGGWDERWGLHPPDGTPFAVLHRNY